MKRIICYLLVFLMAIMPIQAFASYETEMQGHWSNAYIEKAFVESYRLTCSNNKDALNEFIERAKESLNDDTFDKEYDKAQKEVKAIEAKINKLVDLQLEGRIDKAIYDVKYEKLLNQLEAKKNYCDRMADAVNKKNDTEERLLKFKRVLEKNTVLKKFDPNVFESVIEKVIVGGIDEDGNKDPAQLIFVYKTGISNTLNGSQFKPGRKNGKEAKNDTNQDRQQCLPILFSQTNDLLSVRPYSLSLQTTMTHFLF